MYGQHQPQKGQQANGNSHLSSDDETVYEVIIGGLYYVELWAYNRETLIEYLQSALAVVEALPTPTDTDGVQVEICKRCKTPVIGTKGIVQNMYDHLEECPEEIIATSGIPGYLYERCPHCKTAVFGTKDDIDSGMRKHIEYCEVAQKFLYDIADDDIE